MSSSSMALLLLCGIGLPVQLYAAQQPATQQPPIQQVAKAQVADEKVAAGDDVHELVGVVTLSYSDRLDLHHAKVQLPSLEAGKRYRLALQVINPSEKEVSFYGVEFQNIFTKLETKINIIPQGGAEELVFLIDVPKRSKQAKVFNQARFLHRGARHPSMQLDLHYELNNMFSVAESLVNLELAPGQADAHALVPVLLIPPVTADQLELVASEKLRDLEIKLIDNVDGTFISVLANRQNLSGGAISGEVAVRRKGTEDSDGFLLTARSRSALEMNPKSLRLVRGEGNLASKYVGNAVLRVSRESEEISSDLQPEVTLEIAGRKASVELRRLGKSHVYRLRIVIDAQEVSTETQPVEIRWRMALGEDARQIRSHAYLPQ